MTTIPCRVSPILRPALRPLLIAAAVLAVGLNHAQATDLTVVSGPAVARVLADLRPRIEELTHRTLVIDAVPPSALTTRLTHGDPFDVAVAYEADAITLLKSNRLVVGRLSCIGWTRLGLAAPAGAPLPWIGNVSDLKQRVLAARSIGYNADAPSGSQFRNALTQIGLLDKIGAHLVDLGSEDPLDAVSRGAVELGVAYVGDIAAAKGLRSLGPLPWQVQQLTPIYAGVGREAQDRAAAQRLIAFMSSFEATAVLTAHDLEGTPNE